MEKQTIKGEEVVSYTVEEFIKATRPDGLGHIYVDGIHCGGMREVLCDCCNAEIVQPENEPQRLMVHVLANNAWCGRCFFEWAGGDK